MISFESVSVFFLAPGKEGDLSVLAAALIEGDSEVPFIEIMSRYVFYHIDIDFTCEKCSVIVAAL